MFSSRKLHAFYNLLKAPVELHSFLFINSVSYCESKSRQWRTVIINSSWIFLLNWKYKDDSYWWMMAVTLVIILSKTKTRDLKGCFIIFYSQFITTLNRNRILILMDSSWQSAFSMDWKKLEMLFSDLFLGFSIE